MAGLIVTDCLLDTNIIVALLNGDETARRFIQQADRIYAPAVAIGEISLKVKGKPIPENDIWIAACALQHNLSLVTRDAHFQEVPGLQIATV